jgi:pimeloyl-ACP methyl ester carboxylesterase
VTSLLSCTALLVIAQMVCGCVTVDVKLASFMSPDRGPRTATLAPGYAVQDVTLRRGERTIGITHAHHPQSRVLIVFCGGDRFHRSIEGGEALEVLARNADVVLFDYPGYGDTSGTPTPLSILETALAVYDYASGLETSAGKKRVVYGFSLGGLVAAHVAGLRGSEGLILEATAQNAERWARRQIPWYARPIITPRIEASLASVDAAAVLRHYRGEVLILGGAADRHAPSSLSADIDRALRLRRVKSSFVEFPDAEHGAIPHAAEFSAVLSQFLSRVPERA